MLKIEEWFNSHPYIQPVLTIFYYYFSEKNVHPNEDYNCSKSFNAHRINNYFNCKL